MILNNVKKFKKAFSLVEILIVVFIMSVAFVSFYTVSTVGTKYIIESKNRLAAIALANEKMEIVRNMAYDDIGTVGGFVAGDIKPDEDVIANGRPYNVKTFIDYVDDALDQTDVNDENGIPNDYKTVKIIVSWTDSNGQTQEVSSLARFVPPGLETAIVPPGASWIMNVSENSGGSLVGVSGSEIHIVNNDVSPAIDTNPPLTTNSDGIVIIPSAPESAGGYQITVSKSGYETIETMDTTATFTPVYPHASVALGSLNLYNVIQDQLSRLTIRTADYQDAPIGSINFSIAGGKLVGHESGVPVYHMSSIASSEVYGQQSDNGTTGASGTKIYDSLSPGSYMIEMNPSTQNGYDFIDFDPSVSPAALGSVSQTYTMRVAPSNVNALLIRITDDDEDAPSPVANATAKLTDAGSVEIFSGKTSSLRGIIFYPDGATPLLAGNYTLEIEAIGFVTKTEPVTIIDGDITEKDIQLTPST